MKATMRKNGVRMLDLSVKFTVGYDDVLYVVAQLVHNEQPPRSRAEVLSKVRHNMHEYGYWGGPSHPADGDGGSDGSDDASQAEHAEAVRIVDRLFPDLGQP